VELQRQFYENVGANVSYEMNPRYGHKNKTCCVARDLTSWILTNLPGSGFTSKSDFKPDDPDWAINGYSHKFDQSLIVDQLKEEYGGNQDFDMEFL